MLPVLSAFDVFVFTCFLPRFQLWLVVMLRLPGLCPCGLLCFRGQGFCQGQWPISGAVRCACRCGCVRCIAHSSRGFCLLGMKTWIFQERVLKQESQVSQVPQVVPQQVQLPLREVFPECWERNSVDLVRISAKIGVPHSILCDIAFEQNLEEMSVDEVRAAARSLVASEPVGEEEITQAAAAPSRDLRTRSGEEENNLEKKWSPPQKSVKEVFVKSLEGKLLLFSFTEEDTVLDLHVRVAKACKVSVDQFVLVFQSRTLQFSAKIESTGVQRGHTFYMQGASKGEMQRQ